MLTQPEKRLATCPEKSALKNYLLGKLSDEILDQFESHFSDCADCEETLRGLDANDTFSQLVNSAADSSEELDEQDKQFVGNLITQMKSEDRFHRLDGELAEKAAEVTRLLAPPEDDSDVIGTFGDYQVESLIGVGSTGVVFRAVDRKLNRLVALKILRPSLGRAARERFMAEARLAAAIEHQNVVTIYQVGEEEVGGLHPIAFIAMQWVAGETLEDRFKKVAFLPEDEVKEIASQIALGLSAAHQKNLIHRDIKPANIWLCEESNRVIILDFGLARIADDDPHMTNTGMLAGTPNFMSPEQTRGQELDGRSDLFSLGCLMYRTSTGKLPFGSSGVLATLQSIQTYTPNPPAMLNPHISDDLSDLVMCLLEKQTANRPENAAQLIEAIKLPRTKWEFIAANHQKIEPKSKSLPQRSSGFTAWVSVAILFGLVASFGYMFAPDIIRIATNQGELIIDSKDKDIKIEILSGGEVIKVIDTKTEQAINIKAGDYSFQVQDARNGFSVSPSKLTMTRGGEEVVTISSSNTAVNAKGKNEPSITDSIQNVTVKGKSLREWELILRTEKDPDAVKDAIDAIKLFLSEEHTREKAVNIVSEFARKKGASELTKYSNFEKSFQAFFRELPPIELWKFYESTFSMEEPGNKSTYWVFRPSEVYSDTTKQIGFRKILQEKQGAIIDHLTSLLRSGVEEEVMLGKFSLNIFVTHAAGRSPELGYDDTFFWQLSNESLQSLHKCRRGLDDPDVIFYVTAKAILNGDFSPESLGILLAPIESETSDFVWDTEQFLSRCSTYPNALMLKAVGPIQNLLNNESKCRRLVQLSKSDDVFSADGVRKSWIKILTKFGANGAPALPTLKDLVKNASNSSLIELISRQAIDVIEAQIAIKNAMPHVTVKTPFSGGIDPQKNVIIEVSNFSPKAIKSAVLKIAFDKSLKPKTATTGFVLEESVSSLSSKIPTLAPGDIYIAQVKFDVLRFASKTQLRVILMSNGEKIVENSLETRTVQNWAELQPIPPPRESDNQKNSSSRTYGGKTFAEWVSILKTERDGETINQGLKAIAQLSHNDDKLQKLAIDAVRPIVRKHGGLDTDRAGHVDAITEFFNFIPSNLVLDFVVEEVKSGTAQSQLQLFWLLSPNNMVEYVSATPEVVNARQAEHLRNLKTRHPEISKACDDAMEKANRETKESLAMVQQWATSFSKSSLEQLNSPLGSAGGNVQPGTKAVVSTTKNTPTYDGKTFNEWYSVLLTERNHKTINQALTAVGILSKENAGLQKLAINRVRTIAQRHGSLVIDDVNHVESITKFFQNIPSNSTLDFVLEEIQSGTVQSQLQCFWLLMPNYLYGESAGNYQTLLENRKSHWKNIQARSSHIATACIDAMEKAKSDKKLALAMVLQRVIFEATHDPSKPQNSPGGFFALELPVPIQPDDEPREKLFELLTNRLKTTKDAETATFLAIEMLRNDTANQLAVDQIVKSLFDENMPDWFPTIIFDEFIVRTSHQFPKQAASEIVKLFENEELLERILTSLKDPKLFGMLSNRNNANRPTIESIRIELIQILGKYGKDATNATDWLTEQSTLQVPWANEAKKALSQIASYKKTNEKDKAPSKGTSSKDSFQPKKDVAFIEFPQTLTGKST